MNLRKFMYGSMGFLSFIGFLGIITNEKSFLLFFAFVIDFDYWFMKSDEMLEEYMLSLIHIYLGYPHVHH